jgi:hypothetical protein
MTEISELNATQRARLMHLCFPKVTVHPAEYPVDAALGLIGLVNLLKVGEDKEVACASAEGQYLAREIRKHGTLGTPCDWDIDFSGDHQ